MRTRHYPLCKKCGLPLKRYDTTYHRVCYFKVHPQTGKNNNAYKSEVCKPFYQINKKGKIMAIWQSLGEVARCLEIKPYYIQRVLHGKFKTCRKCYWRYL